jgi:ribosomal protein L6P/L9E
MDPTMRSLVNNFVLGTEEHFAQRTKTGELGFAIEKLQNGKSNFYHILALDLCYFQTYWYKPSSYCIVALC